LKVKKRTDTINSQDWVQEEQLDKLRPLSSLFSGKLEPQKEKEIFTIKPKQTLGVFLLDGAAVATAADNDDDDEDDDDETKRV